jgi:hypothetical protein
VTVTAEPLREALLEQARVDAERALGHADEQVALKLRDAEERGREIVERARAEGTAAAAIASAHEEARARQRARTLVLATRLELYEELARQSRAAAHAFRGDPGYRTLLERLSAAARFQLGEGTALEVDPLEGGVRASSGARHVDYTLDALVERCLEGLGSEVERLWR